MALTASSKSNDIDSPSSMLYESDPVLSDSEPASLKWYDSDSESLKWYDIDSTSSKPFYSDLSSPKSNISDPTSLKSFDCNPASSKSYDSDRDSSKSYDSSPVSSKSYASEPASSNSFDTDTASSKLCPYDTASPEWYDIEPSSSKSYASDTASPDLYEMDPASFRSYANDPASQKSYGIDPAVLKSYDSDYSSSKSFDSDDESKASRFVCTSFVQRVSNTAVTLNICEACQEVPAIANCIDCPMKLCKSCIKIHGKVKASAQHVVCKSVESLITYQTPCTQSLSELLGNCERHPEKYLYQYCKTCHEFICENCEDEHASHRIEKLCNDSYMYQTLSCKIGHRLCEYYKEFDSFKKHAESIRKHLDQSLDRIKEIEQKLLTEIKDNACRSRGELQHKRDQFHTISNHLDDITRADIDDNLRKLHGLRHEANLKVYVTLFSEMNLLINSLNNRKKRYTTVMQAEKKHPCLNRQDIASMKLNIFKFFTISPDLGEKVEIEENAEKYGPPGFKICSNFEDTKLVVYKGSDVRQLNVVTLKLEKFVSHVDIYCMAQLTEEEYVCVERKELEEYCVIHILHGDFSKKCSYTEASGFVISSVSRLSDTSFMCCQIPWEGSGDRLIEIMKIEGSSFITEQNIILGPGRPVLKVQKHPKSGLVYLSGHREWYTLDIEKSEVNTIKHRLMDDIFCLTHAGAIICNNSDRIVQLAHPDMMCYYLKLDKGTITDMDFVGGRLIVLTNDYSSDIWIYS